MKKVYIASAYTLGDVAVNVKRQMEAANTLIDLGYAPFAPLMSHFQHIVYPRPYADWIILDIEWLYACDAVLRLPGESKGADNEVTLAKAHGIPVYNSFEDLLNAEG